MVGQHSLTVQKAGQYRLGLFNNWWKRFEHQLQLDSRDNPLQSSWFDNGDRDKSNDGRFTRKGPTHSDNFCPYVCRTDPAKARQLLFTFWIVRYKAVIVNYPEIW